MVAAPAGSTNLRQLVRAPDNSSNFGCPVALSPDGRPLAVGSLSAAATMPGAFASDGTNGLYHDA